MGKPVGSVENSLAPGVGLWKSTSRLRCGSFAFDVLSVAVIEAGHEQVKKTFSRLFHMHAVA